jgi:hypothetical protein
MRLVDSASHEDSGATLLRYEPFEAMGKREETVPLS